MTTKKVFGYIFIALAALLSITIVGQTAAVFEILFQFIRIFTGSLSSYQIGYLTGKLIFWVFLFALTAILWIYGIRWINAKKVIREDKRIESRPKD